MNALREPTWLDRLCRTLATHSWQLRHRLSFIHRVRTPSGTALVPVINRTGELYWREFLAEGWMVRTIRTLHHFKPGTFLDVGANVGQTLLHVRAADPAIPYIGCEPLAAEVACIHQLVRLNRYAAVRIFPIALGSAQGAARLRIPEDNRMSTLVSSITYRDFVGQVDALVMRGDDLLELAGVDDVAIVKIDVEGFEAEVVAGLERTLAGRRPFLILEVLPYSADDRGGAERAAALQERLTKSDFVFRRIRNSGRLERTDTLGLSYPSHAHHRIDFSDANYLAVPAEAAEAFDRHAVGIENAASADP